MKTSSYSILLVFLLAGLFNFQTAPCAHAQKKIYRAVTNDYVANGTLAYPRKKGAVLVNSSAYPSSTTSYSYNTFNIASTSITTSAGAVFNVVTAGTTQTISLPSANTYPLRHVKLKVVWTVLASGVPALSTTIGLIQDKGGGVTYSATPIGLGSIVGNTYFKNVTSDMPEEITFDDEDSQSSTQLADKINVNVTATAPYTLGYTGSGQSVGGVLGNFTNATSGGINDSSGTWTLSFRNGDSVNYKLYSFTITGTSNELTPTINLGGGGTISVNVSTRSTYQGKSQTNAVGAAGGVMAPATSRKDSQQ